MTTRGRQSMTKLLTYLRPFFWILITASLLSLAIYGVFNSGRFMTCIWGLVIAITLYWMRSKHLAFYGLTEVAAGLFILAQKYEEGRGGFSSGFSTGFQTFHWNIVLVATLGAVYIMVRGIDNFLKGITEKDG
jgi:hypothetical protein